MTEKDHLEEAIKNASSPEQAEALKDLRHRLFGYMEADGGMTEDGPS